MNRLSESDSLYLRQHADNPVAWQPWDDAALELARNEGKPILVSIGYSACHWCHVMAHESFEDATTAAVMNELFINIKVDREERPDLDKLYQLSHQLLTGRGGGWPLTVFLDPDDLGAFFAGTYFPPMARHGLPSFVDLLRKVRQWYDANRGAVTAQNRRLQEAIESLSAGGGEAPVSCDDLLENAFAQIEARYDRLHGGFGGAPKFPQAPLLSLVAALGDSAGPYSEEASSMLANTLESMAYSGLRDHLDGGFFRYTVDGSWTIPHFEKMLYDNAQLLPLYAEAAARTGSATFEHAAKGIGDWLLTEMRQKQGAFSASIDADADGQEGGFHVWDRDQVRVALGEKRYPEFSRAFGLGQPPNFEEAHWHLLRTDHKLQGFARECSVLRSKREQRVPPAMDTKILTAWNALCVDGLARAGLALRRQDWVSAAADTLLYLRETAWRDSRLYAVIHDGKPAFPAYLDDHAFLLQATLSVLQARWQDGLMLFARQLADTLLERFLAPDGGFYFTAADQAAPVARMRILQDDATPNGNAVAAMALQELAGLDASGPYAKAAQYTLDSTLSELEAHPVAHASLLAALGEHRHPAAQVIILGGNKSDQRAWREVALSHDRVNCYVVPAEASGRPGAVSQLPPPAQTLALVCLGMHCLPTLSRREELEQALGER